MAKKPKYHAVLHGDDTKAIRKGKAVLKKMSPGKFLKEAEPLDATSGDKSIIHTFEDDIKDGDVLGALRLYKKGQDGRHRAKAAKKLGVKEMDVVDYRKKKATGGPVLPLGDDDPNAAFRRLISWSFAVAPLFGRAEGGAVDRHAYATDGGVEGDVQFAPDDQQEAVNSALTAAKSLYQPAREATMSAYEPTIGERIYGAVAGLGSERPSPERRHFAEGVKELAGLTPGLGNVMAAQEAKRAGERGDYGDMALASLGALPAIGPAERKAAEVAENAIRAYHGSPHAFDKFQMSKIGTGEGAQAYGHGLYFAENEDVAKQYRENLSEDNLSEAELDAKQALDQAGWHKDTAISNLRARQSNFLKNFSDTKNESQLKDYNDKKDEAEKIISDWSERGELPQDKRGHMYEVRLNAGPEHLLDWDAPLSEQHPAVQEAFGFKKPKMPDFVATETGHENPVWKYSVKGYPAAPTEEQAIKNAIDTFNSNLSSRGQTGEQIYKNLFRENKADAELTSAKLRDLGLRGIRYLDQGSRGAGEGSRNYVIFDPEHINVQRRYAKGGTTPDDGIVAYAFGNSVPHVQDRLSQLPEAAKAGGSIIDRALGVISKLRGD